MESLMNFGTVLNVLCIIWAPFFEHPFCNVFGSIVNELLDRAFGENLVFTIDPLQNKDSQVPILL